MADDEHPLDKKFREEREEVQRQEAFRDNQDRAADQLKAHIEREWPHAEQRLEEEIALANKRLEAYGKPERYFYHRYPQAFEDKYRSHVQLHHNPTAQTVCVDIRVLHDGSVIVAYRSTSFREPSFAVNHGTAAKWRHILTELHRHLT